MPSPTLLEFLGADAYSAPRGRDYPPHFHRCWELVFYREGHIEVHMGDEVYATRPGTLMLTPPGVTHSEKALTAYSNYFITLKAPADIAWPLVVNDDARGSLGYLCGALVDECRREASQKRQPVSDGGPAMTDLLLAQLNVLLHRSLTAPALAAGERVVCEAERIFEENAARTLSMESIASRIGVAPSVLRAHFARFRGYSPSEALLRIRLRHALALLQNSNLTLREVATACGFHSPSHLSRHVKTSTGQAPGSWRNRS